MTEQNILERQRQEQTSVKKRTTMKMWEKVGKNIVNKSLLSSLVNKFPFWGYPLKMENSEIAVL